MDANERALNTLEVAEQENRAYANRADKRDEERFIMQKTMHEIELDAVQRTLLVEEREVSVKEEFLKVMHLFFQKYNGGN